MTLRTIALMGATLLAAATVAIAAADIPTRYSGAFPSTRNFRNVSGTFTGAALRLRGKVRNGTVAVAGQYACSKLSSTQTRCAGSLRSDDGVYNKPHTVTITWATGTPIAMSGAH